MLLVEFLFVKTASILLFLQCKTVIVDLWLPAHNYSQIIMVQNNIEVVALFHIYVHLMPFSPQCKKIHFIF